MIIKAMSSEQLESWLSHLILALLLFLLLLLAFSISLASRTQSEFEEHHSEDHHVVSSQWIGSGAGHYLCPELVPEANVTGGEQVYSLQHPGAQVPGEMVVEKASGDLVARVRTGIAGGAILVLVAPGGAVLASCEEVKTKDVAHLGTSNSCVAFLLIKDRLGHSFAEIFDKGHIEAHLHNGQRVTVVRQAQTGAMSVVNERRQLLATVEPVFHDDSHHHLTLWPQSRHLHIALKILPGADLGMILLTLLAHSCFERRRTRSLSSVEAPPLLRIAP